MSKKSRKRNKKILAMLALAGGAAMMAKRKKASIADTDDAGIGVTHSALTDSAPVVKTDVAPVDTAPKTIIPRGAGHPIIRGNINRHKAAIAAANTPGHGTAVAPPGILNPYRAPRGAGPRRFSKGGRVTGIAKRGFGRALMKGKK
jgi:hypothetical protein